MNPLRVARAAALVTTVLALTASAASAQAAANLLSIKVSRESAPPGSIAQVKVFVTEPKPITTGRATASFESFSDLEGIALGDTDAIGVAVVNGGNLVLSVVSPSGAYGTIADYPVLTIAGRVARDAPLGQRVPVTFEPGALQFLDPTGTVYAAEVNDGYLMADDTLSVADVVPGSADLPAGARVSIYGTGFTADTRVTFKETKLAQVLLVSPGQIDVILAQPARMHGMGIRVRNSNKADTMYFSYQRTRAFNRSAHPVLQNVVPIFPNATTRGATIELVSTTAGVAVQNIEDVTAFVTAELLDEAGAPLEFALIEVPASRFAVRDLTEIFATGGGSSVRLTSDVPVQVMGVDVSATGAASPRLPR